MLFATTVAALALSSLAGAAGSGPSTMTFPDPTGDAAGAADITNVAVNGDAGSGTITFTFTATGLALPSADGSERSVDLWLNTDRNDATGSPAGNEYDLFFWTDSTDPAQRNWDIENYANGAWQEAAATATMHASGSGDQFTIQVNKSDLGGATSFDVYATSSTFDANGNVVGHDNAPDQGRWVYNITGPSQSLTTLVTPTIGKPMFGPAKPTAGKRFTVSFPVTMSRLGQVRAVRGRQDRRHRDGWGQGRRAHDLALRRRREGVVPRPEDSHAKDGEGDDYGDRALVGERQGHLGQHRHRRNGSAGHDCPGRFRDKDRQQHSPLTVRHRPCGGDLSRRRAAAGRARARRAALSTAGRVALAR